MLIPSFSAQAKILHLPSTAGSSLSQLVPHLTPHRRLAGFPFVLVVYSHWILEQELAFKDHVVFPTLLGE